MKSGNHFIINLSLDQIKPYQNNVKIHTAEQIEKIAKSIKDNGYTSYISVDKKNTIVCGHARYEALKKLYPENTKIPVISLSALPPKAIKKLRILDNTLNSTKYDDELLNIEISSLFKNLDENIKDISDEFNIDISKIIKFPQEEIEKKATSRKASTEVQKIVLEYNARDYKKVSKMADDAMNRLEIESVSDLFLCLLKNEWPGKK